MRAGGSLMRYETRRPHTGSRNAGRVSVAGIASGKGRREAFGSGEVAGDESHVDLPLAEGRVWSRKGRARVGVATGHRTPVQAHGDAAGAGVPLDQRQGPAALRLGFRAVDSADRSTADRSANRVELGS